MRALRTHGSVAFIALSTSSLSFLLYRISCTFLFLFSFAARTPYAILMALQGDEADTVVVRPRSRMLNADEDQIPSDSAEDDTDGGVPEKVRRRAAPTKNKKKGGKER